MEAITLFSIISIGWIVVFYYKKYKQDKLDHYYKLWITERDL